MNVIGLSVEVPVASFRMPYAREFAESYEIPPPATVYGMFLSLVGEENRYRHIGARVAIARVRPMDKGAEHFSPNRSVILRTFRRIKKKPISDPTNARPDFQEVLTGLRLAVWVDSSAEKEAEPTLAERLGNAFSAPDAVQRFGGLSLGESRDLVDSVSLLPDETAKPDHPFRPGASCQWLEKDDLGSLAMPFWVDHVGSAKTLWASYEFSEGKLGVPGVNCWTAIFPPKTY
jgi:CRISPR-associated protein Cas5t